MEKLQSYVYVYYATYIVFVEITVQVALYSTR